MKYGKIEELMRKAGAPPASYYRGSTIQCPMTLLILGKMSVKRGEKSDESLDELERYV